MSFIPSSIREGGTIHINLRLDLGSISAFCMELISFPPVPSLVLRVQDSGGQGCGWTRAMAGDLRACLPRLPEHFCADIEYKEYQDAEKFSYYPGAERLDAKTVRFEADDYYEVKRFFMFAI